MTRRVPEGFSDERTRSALEKDSVSYARSKTAVGQICGVRFPARRAGPGLVEPDRLCVANCAGRALTDDRRYAWLKAVPEKIVSWGFRNRVRGRGID
jgi:hypothetical protein